MSQTNGVIPEKTIEKTVAEAKFQKAIAQQHDKHLSKVGACIAIQLNVMLDSDHDKLCLLVGLMAGMSVNAGGTLEELQAFVKEGFEHQLKAKEAQAPA